MASHLDVVFPEQSEHARLADAVLHHEFGGVSAMLVVENQLCNRIASEATIDVTYRDFGELGRASAGGDCRRQVLQILEAFPRNSVVCTAPY